MTSYRLAEALKTDPILTRWFAFTGLLVLWIATRPYCGIIIDAQLYTFQAMAKLNPEQLSSDIFLKYGSQDRFTIYAYILAYVISILGIVKANFLMTILGGGLWLIASAFLASSLFSVFSDRLAAMWSVIILPAAYGATYSYAQQYQSPRLYGEAIALAAIAFALRKMWFRACLALIVGVFVHPLMILYGLGMVFLLAAQERRLLWLMPLVGIACLFGLSLLNIEPFARIIYIMPAEWWKVVTIINWSSFITHWSLADYILIFMQINIGILAFYVGECGERKLLRALATLVFISLLTSLIGADWLHDLLFINLQTYRGLCLFSTTINLFSGVLFLRLLNRPGVARYYIMLSLALTVFDRYISIEIFPVSVLLLLSSLSFWWETKKKNVSRLWALPIFALALLTTAATMIMLYLEARIQLTNPNDLFYFDNISLIAIALFSILVFLWWNKILGCMTLTATLVFGAVNFNQSTSWQRFVEGGEHPPAQILKIIDTTQNVYWEASSDYLWFNLNHASYYSGLQCVGSMFFKLTADECERRSTILSQLDTSDFGNRADGHEGFPKSDFNTNGPKSIVQIENVCKELPDLGLIVLFTKVSGGMPVEWTAPVPQYSTQISSIGVVSIKPENHYYFYDCVALRTSRLKRAALPTK